MKLFYKIILELINNDNETDTGLVNNCYASLQFLSLEVKVGE